MSKRTRITLLMLLGSTLAVVCNDSCLDSCMKYRSPLDCDRMCCKSGQTVRTPIETSDQSSISNSPNNEWPQQLQECVHMCQGLCQQSLPGHDDCGDVCKEVFCIKREKMNAKNNDLILNLLGGGSEEVKSSWTEWGIKGALVIFGVLIAVGLCKKRDKAKLEGYRELEEGKLLYPQ